MCKDLLWIKKIIEVYRGEIKQVYSKKFQLLIVR